MNAARRPMWRKFWSGIVPRLSPPASTAVTRQQTSREEFLPPRLPLGSARPNCVASADAYMLENDKLMHERDPKVAENDNSDDHKVTLAQQIFGRAAAISGRNPPEPRTNDAPEAKTPPVAREVSPA